MTPLSDLLGLRSPAAPELLLGPASAGVRGRGESDAEPALQGLLRVGGTAGEAGLGSPAGEACTKFRLAILIFLTCRVPSYPKASMHAIPSVYTFFPFTW